METPSQTDRRRIEGTLEAIARTDTGAAMVAPLHEQDEAKRMSILVDNTPELAGDPRRMASYDREKNAIMLPANVLEDGNDPDLTVALVRSLAFAQQKRGLEALGTDPMALAPRAHLSLSRLHTAGADAATVQVARELARQTPTQEYQKPGAAWTGMLGDTNNPYFNLANAFQRALDKAPAGQTADRAIETGAPWRAALEAWYVTPKPGQLSTLRHDHDRQWQRDADAMNEERKGLASHYVNFATVRMESLVNKNGDAPGDAFAKIIKDAPMLVCLGLDRESGDLTGAEIAVVGQLRGERSPNLLSASLKDFPAIVESYPFNAPPADRGHLDTLQRDFEGFRTRLDSLRGHGGQSSSLNKLARTAAERLMAAKR